MRQRTGLALLTALLALTACAPSLTTGRDARATPAVPAAPSPTAAATVAPTAAPGGAIYAGAPRDLAMAAGAGGQRLYLIPARDLVVVRLARGGDWTDRAFLARLLDGIEAE
jgi:hypothetical protein